MRAVKISHRMQESARRSTPAVAQAALRSSEHLRTLVVSWLFDALSRQFERTDSSSWFDDSAAQVRSRTGLGAALQAQGYKLERQRLDQHAGVAADLSLPAVGFFRCGQSPRKACAALGDLDMALLLRHDGVLGLYFVPGCSTAYILPLADIARRFEEIYLITDAAPSR